MMPICRICEDELDKEEMVQVKWGEKRKKVWVCSDCAERREEETLVELESEEVIQEMMGFKGRR